MAVWQSALKALGFFVGMILFIPYLVAVIVSPTWGPVAFWGTILLGSAWCVWTLITRWYPALKNRLGLSHARKVLVGLNALAWLPGYCLARYLLNSLTGVDAGYFPTALWFFTLGGMGYVWLNLIMFWLFMMCLKALVVMVGLSVWGHVRTVFWDLPQAIQFKRSLHIGRYGKDLFASFCVMALLNMGFGYLIKSRTLESVSTFALYYTEFSQDRTCAASSATQWVIPLKDRKEFKATNVLVANYHTWNNISFKIDQCDNTLKARENPAGIVELSTGR